MVATDAKTARTKKKKKKDRQIRINVVFGRNVLSAQILKVSIRSRSSAPSREGCMVNGQMTKASNKMSTPPPRPSLAHATSAWLVEIRLDPSQHRRDASVTDPTTTVMHETNTPLPPPPTPYLSCLTPSPQDLSRPKSPHLGPHTIAPNPYPFPPTPYPSL